MVCELLPVAMAIQSLPSWRCLCWGMAAAAQTSHPAGEENCPWVSYQWFKCTDPTWCNCGSKDIGRGYHSILKYIHLCSHVEEHISGVLCSLCLAGMLCPHLLQWERGVRAQVSDFISEIHQVLHLVIFFLVHKLLFSTLLASIKIIFI